MPPSQGGRDHLQGSGWNSCSHQDPRDSELGLQLWLLDLPLTHPTLQAGSNLPSSTPPAMGDTIGIRLEEAGGGKTEGQGDEKAKEGEQRRKERSWKHAASRYFPQISDEPASCLITLRTFFVNSLWVFCLIGLLVWIFVCLLVCFV